MELVRLCAVCSIMLFSHLVLFLEYTLVHYSARQKYREQVITDARLRKLMAYDEVSAEVLGNPQLAEACGLAGYSSTTDDDPNGGRSAPAVTDTRPATILACSAATDEFLRGPSATRA